MKKLFSFTLILLLLASLLPGQALAKSRGLVVSSENTLVEETKEGVIVYAFARLLNTSTDTYTLKSCLFEVRDTEGNLLGSTDEPALYASKYLRFNEEGYLKATVELTGIPKEKIGACTLTVDGKPYNGRAKIERFACAPAYEKDVTYGGWLCYDYIGATVTNTTSAILFDLEAVFALCDKEGKILNLGYASLGLLNDVGLHPGSTVTVRDINSDAVQAAYTAAGDIPAYVDAIVYREIYS